MSKAEPGPNTRVDLMAALGPAKADPLWEADKAGWRCYVMGNEHCSYRGGSRLAAAWRAGFDAAARSSDAERLML